MGSVAQAVVEFDEAVQAPWRPPLAGATGRRGQLRAVPAPARRTDGGRPGSARVAAAAVHGRRSPSPQTRRPAPVGPGPRRPVPGCAPDVQAAPALRLTRRARRLGVVLGLAVGVVVGSWVGSVVTGDGEGLRLAGESSVVVQQGDTLWSIAASVSGNDDDVRAVIADIRELNGLSDASLVPGQTLLLP
jgi:nucleoid-associated protein YgaU